MRDPGDLRAIDEIAFATGMHVRPVRADEADLSQALGVTVNPAPAPEEVWLVPDAIEMGPQDEAHSAQARWLVSLAETL